MPGEIRVVALTATMSEAACRAGSFIDGDIHEPHRTSEGLNGPLRERLLDAAGDCLIDARNCALLRERSASVRSYGVTSQNRR